MENPTSTIQKFTRSISFKLMIIGVLALLLLIPASMIESLIHERESRRDEVITEVSSKWGYAQTLTGPTLTIPYKKWVGLGTDAREVINYIQILPDELNINGEIVPETRSRSLYDVVLYTADLKVSTLFKSFPIPIADTSTIEVLWDQAVLSLGIPDMRGIQERIVFQVNGKPFDANPGLDGTGIASYGVSTGLKVDPKNPVRVNFDLIMNGSQSFQVIPIGKTSELELHSTWANPSFDGAFLPDTHSITDQGFHAKWSVLDLNRNFPQSWLNKAHSVQSSAFGLRLVDPIDHYAKSYRSVKYALMFIGLTLLIFFFAELKKKIRIHPVQYLLIGLALVVFYTLLISLSEHMSFNAAFGISASAIVVMITGFAATLVKSKGFVITVGSCLSALYLFLFTMLQLQDYSLLMGSLGLFIALGLLMWASRKVDWYGQGS